MPQDMFARASKMVPTLRARQLECETSGNVPQDVNNELIRAGFYRIVQPRRFGGYEFDIPTFYRVMMEISRGCSETGWVLALTAARDFPQVTILLMTGFAHQRERASGLNAIAYDVISKPFSVADIRTAVADALASRKTG